VNGGEIAALIAAGAFAMLVLVLAVPLLRLRHTVDAATRAIKDLNDRSAPILAKADVTVDNVNTALGQVHVSLDAVNLQLQKVDAITGHAVQVSAGVANLAGVVTSVASNPLVKVAAFGYGVRKAAARRSHQEQEQEARALVREQRRERRRGKTRRGRRKPEG
jgi:uncharacterized protein YoxC